MTNPSEIVPLSTITDGSTVRLVAIDAGIGLKSRLASMGLTPGTSITVINNSHPGPFIIELKGAKMMLGRGMAQKIMVKKN